MRWNKVFSKTGLLAVMLVVIGIGIFFYERQYCGAEQPARYETQQLRLDRRRQVADLIQKKRAMIGELKKPLLSVAARRTGGWA